MNHLFLRPALAVLAVASLSLTSCDKDDDASGPAVTPTLEAKTVTSLEPDAASSGGSGGQPASPRHYTFYSFATGKVPYTDSATTKWDVAFRGTTILTNGGASGPGQGGALVKDGLFAEVAAAPETGYAVDAAATKAIPTGSGKGWYNYNATTHVVSPIAGKVVVIRTATGKYAKMEVTNYYKDAPTTPVGTEPSGYYTFRFVYQPDGSKNLK